MKEEKIKTSITIFKDLLKKMEADGRYKIINNRSTYINQIIRHHFGMPSMFDMEKKE